MLYAFCIIADVNEKLKVIREDALKLTEVLIGLQQKQISEVKLYNHFIVYMQLNLEAHGLFKS